MTDHMIAVAGRRSEEWRQGGVEVGRGREGGREGGGEVGRGREEWRMGEEVKKK